MTNTKSGKGWQWVKQIKAAVPPCCSGTEVYDAGRSKKIKKIVNHWQAVK